MPLTKIVSKSVIASVLNSLVSNGDDGDDEEGEEHGASTSDPIRNYQYRSQESVHVQLGKLSNSNSSKSNIDDSWLDMGLSNPHGGSTRPVMEESCHDSDNGRICSTFHDACQEEHEQQLFDIDSDSDTKAIQILIAARIGLDSASCDRSEFANNGFKIANTETIRTKQNGGRKMIRLDSCTTVDISLKCPILGFCDQQKHVIMFEDHDMAQAEVMTAADLTIPATNFFDSNPRGQYMCTSWMW